MAEPSPSPIPSDDSLVPRVVIRPSRGWETVDWSELWAHRDLWAILAARDIRVRYKQTLLGASWAVFQPLLAMLIFTLIFGRSLGVAGALPPDYVARFDSQTVAYALFVFTGLLPWTFFANTVTGAANSLVQQSQIMTKVYFPRILMPLGVLGYTGLDLAMSAILLLGFMAVVGAVPTTAILWLPAAAVGIFACAVGSGVFLAAMTVKYRDVRFVIGFLVQMWLFATPVIYPVTVFPERWRWVAHLNPMTGSIEAIRAGLLGLPLDAGHTAVSIGIGLAILGGGLAYFRQVEDYFADIV